VSRTHMCDCVEKCVSVFSGLYRALLVWIIQGSFAERVSGRT